jgi:RsiW-degrading membrane proteinase PrsW (M82 family)
MWTAFTSDGRPEQRKPRLPLWLSVPVIVCAPLVALGLVGLIAVDPVAFVAGLVPLAIVLPVVSWLDRVEPEPRASRAHALLWGASVAVVVALVANTVVAVAAGEVAAAVISAPLVEEAMKGLGIVWAVRRREVDSVSDGVVYAAWVALGFAVVEDMSYFAIASVEGALVPVFILRALLTPFAHPLFTFWTGLAIGRAVRDQRPIVPSALWGFGLAVVCHMAWNGSLSIAEIDDDITDDVANGVVVLTMLLFVALFVSVTVALVRMRRGEQRRFEQMMPFLVQRYALTPEEASMFVDWRGVRRARRDLPRSDRPGFDHLHAVLARLSMQHERLGQLEPDAERVLVAQLELARAKLRR